MLRSTIRVSTILSRRIAISRNFTTTIRAQANAINNRDVNLNNNVPVELLRISLPKPIRHEIIESKDPLKTKDLENIDINITLHHEPVTIADKIAFADVKLLRLPTAWFFKNKYMPI